MSVLRSKLYWIAWRNLDLSAVYIDMLDYIDEVFATDCCCLWIKSGTQKNR